MAFSNRILWQGAIANVMAATANITGVSVASATTRTADTITVPGAAVGDIVLGVSAPAALGALQLLGEVTAANTVTLKFSNTTAGALTPPTGNYTAIVLHLDPIMLT